jgi:hypothetical protein
MGVQTDDIVAFIQVHCLWQFVSRANDREENINGVLSLAFRILIGESPKCETPDERCHFANANRLASEMKSALPWLEDLPKKDLADTLSAVNARIQDITVKHSLNEELTQPGY